MNAPRFREQRSASTTSRPGLAPPSVQWLPFAKSNAKSIRDLLAKASRSKSRRLFALISRPVPPSPGTNPIRRVLIFDNHPDTLRLLATSRPPLEESAPLSDLRLGLYVFLGTVLIGLAVMAMFWPLIAR